MAVLRFFEHAYLPAADGPSRLVQHHDYGENGVDPDMVASVFPYDQIGMAQLDAVGDEFAIAAINATTGGASTPTFSAVPLYVGVYCRLGGVPDDEFFFGAGSSGDFSAGMPLLWNSSTGAIDMYYSGGLVDAGAVAIAANTKLYLEYVIGDAASLNIYTVSGTTHTLVEQLAGTGATAAYNLAFQCLGTQTVDVGAGYVATSAFIPIGWQVAVQVPSALGTYQDLNATTAWRTNAGSIVPADIIAALLRRDSENGTNGNTCVCDATVVPKKLSVTMTPSGIAASDTIHFSRWMTCFYNSAAAGGTTGRAFVRYNGTDAFTSAQGPGVQVAVGPGGIGLTHGRGLAIASPTAALLDAAEVGLEYTADGTSNLHFDCAQVMTMYTQDPGRGGSSVPGSMLLMGVE